MGVRRIPNHRLRELLIESGWTCEALAKAVNAVGAEAHSQLAYQRSSVAHWLSGMRPRPPVPEFVAEALSRRLGRRIAVSDTGLCGANGESEDFLGWWTAEPADELDELAATGDSAARASVYRVADLLVPRRFPLTPGGLLSASQRPVGRIGRPEVQAARSMLPLFSDGDSAFGGRYGRSALAAYLGRTIAPWLRARATPPVRRDLLVVGAHLAYLCGFMNFDEWFHGVAQRYYLMSLRMAAEAGDALSYALGLRALSVQARMLGHRRHAVELADGAVRIGLRTAPPQTRAFLLGQLAVAHAAMGERREAVKHLAATERHLDGASAERPLLGAYHRGSFAHQQATVAACLGDRRGAAKALAVAIRRRPRGERRSRAIMLARLAEIQAADGQIESACRTWTEFLADYPHIQSARADAALVNLKALTQPHRHNPAVRQLGHAVAALTPARG
jgi:tetratricopeptide (TPR) repeat protein